MHDQRRTEFSSKIKSSPIFFIFVKCSCWDTSCVYCSESLSVPYIQLHKTFFFVQHQTNEHASTNLEREREVGAWGVEETREVDGNNYHQQHNLRSKAYLRRFNGVPLPLFSAKFFFCRSLQFFVLAEGFVNNLVAHSHKPFLLATYKTEFS